MFITQIISKFGLGVLILVRLEVKVRTRLVVDSDKPESYGVVGGGPYDFSD